MKFKDTIKALLGCIFNVGKECIKCRPVMLGDVCVDIYSPYILSSIVPFL